MRGDLRSSLSASWYAAVDTSFAARRKGDKAMNCGVESAGNLLRRIQTRWATLCERLTAGQRAELETVLDAAWQRVAATTSLEAKKQELAAITARIEAMSKDAWVLARVVHPSRLRGFTKGVDEPDSESSEEAEEECGPVPPRSLRNLVVVFEDLTGFAKPPDAGQDSPRRT